MEIKKRHRISDETLKEVIRAFVEDGTDLETSQKRLLSPESCSNRLASALNNRGIVWRSVSKTDDGRTVVSMRRDGCSAAEIWEHFVPPPAPEPAPEESQAELPLEHVGWVHLSDRQLTQLAGEVAKIVTESILEALTQPAPKPIAA